VTTDSSLPPPLRRVAFYLHSLEEGGAQRRTLRLAQSLWERGISVDLLLVSDQGPLRALLPTGVRVLRVGHLLSRLPWIRSRRVRQVHAAVPQIALYLRRVRPDVLVAAANHTAIATVRAHRLARCPGVALVLRVSNALTSRERARGDTRSRQMRTALRHVDAVAAVSRELAAETQALCTTPAPAVMRVVNPVIDAPAVADLRKAIHRPRSDADASPCVIGVGRLVPQKDFSTLLQAFARLPASMDARLLILGDGPERSNLATLARTIGIAARVEFAGQVADPLPHLCRADLFVLSSRWEGMPGSLIEAMACGCAVVSTDIAGAREVLHDGALAPLVPAGDTEAMTAAMRATLERRPDTMRLVNRAQEYSFDAAANDFLGVLECACARREERG
jgi:glycosyltransferase involved in cell wall biosynthesis